MIVNIGGGTTEIAVIALSGIVAQTAIRVGGHDLDDVIGAHVRRAHNLLIGEATAEAIKVQIGCAHPAEERRSMMVKGRNLISGVPTTIEIGSDEILECMAEPLQAITAAVRTALEVTPPEMAGDIVDDGILLTGGGARLRGLVRMIEEDTHLGVRLDRDPGTTVVRGAGAVLEDMRAYQDAICV
jgi:rod shape-determining protein MreB and related proteins